MVDEVVLDAWTPETITDRRALEDDLAAARERGWALEDGELHERRRSIAAVVRDHQGVAVAAVGIGGWAERLPDADLPELAEAVIGQAAQISGAFGGPLAALVPPRLEVRVIGAIEPPVPPVPRTDTPEGRRRRPGSRRRRAAR